MSTGRNTACLKFKGWSETTTIQAYDCPQSGSIYTWYPKLQTCFQAARGKPTFKQRPKEQGSTEGLILREQLAFWESPIKDLRVANSHQCKIEKEVIHGRQVFKNSHKTGSIPKGMVFVSGGKDLDDFFIDKYEVTNRQFKEFIDQGGYQNKKYWKYRFTREGKELTWDQAIKEFVDQTGRPGPSTWNSGTYPSDRDEWPVNGVSWY
jgi:hypothetical protein